MRLALISDLHFGAIAPEAPQQVLRWLRRDPPDAVLIAGDLTQQGRRSEFAAAADFVRRCPSPCLIVPGNHDIPVRNLWARFTQPLARFRSTLRPLASDRIHQDGLQALGLSSARPILRHWNWSHGRVSARQLATADRWFNGSAASLTALLLHHPPAPPPGMTLPSYFEGRTRLLDWIARHRIDLVLSGHTHEPFAWTPALTAQGETWQALAIGAGTATSTRLRSQARAVTLIETDPDEAETGGATVSVELHRTDDGAAEAQRLFRRHRDIGWEPIQ